MNIKIGNLELDDWILEGGIWYKYYNVPGHTSLLEHGVSLSPKHAPHYSYEEDMKWFPRFTNNLVNLQSIYPFRGYEALEDCKQRVDEFLVRMGGLMAFL